MTEKVETEVGNQKEITTEEKPLFSNLEEATQRYKTLQRELEKAKRRNREAMLDEMSKGEMLAALSRLEEQQEALIDLYGKATEDEGFSEVKQRLVGRKDFDKKALAARNEILETLAEADVEWDDTRLKDVRDDWKNARSLDEFQAVAKRVKRALQETDQSFEDRVRAEVQKQLKGVGRVDTGEGTRSGFTTDPRQLADLIKDPDWWRENGPKLKEEIKRGRVKLE